MSDLPAQPPVGQSVPLLVGAPSFSRPVRVTPGKPLLLALNGETADATQPPKLVEVVADQQTFNERTQVFTATGNVVMTYQGGVLRADQLEVNLDTRMAVAAGNVVLTRGKQVLEGKRLDYNFETGTGVFEEVQGTVALSSLTQDTELNGTPSGQLPVVPPGDAIQAGQPLQIQEGEGRVRFIADRITFEPERWVAENLRITNDPFTPPELVLRTRQARWRQLPNGDEEIVASGGQVVIDQGTVFPLLRDRVILSARGRRSPASPLPFDVDYDLDDLGGVYLSRPIDFPTGSNVDFSLTPLALVQKAIDPQPGRPTVLDYIGLRMNLDAEFTPQTRLTARGLLTQLGQIDPDEDLRGRFLLTQDLPGHTLNFTAGWRERVFNGTLGFENIEASGGVILASVPRTLGSSGVNLRYQVGAGFARSDTEDSDDPDNEVLSLGRYQAALFLDKTWRVWEGRALPPTATEGLRYTDQPVTPYLAWFMGFGNVTSLYGNGASQSLFYPQVGLQAQFGQFSRNWFDYTGFRVIYSPIVQLGRSPFRFDRPADRDVLSFAFVQQVYGPVRAGIETNVRLNDGRFFDINYTLEYSRRTFGILVRFNPDRGIGAFEVRVSGFNWTGSPQPFSGEPATAVP